METKEFSKIVFRCKWIYVSENLRNRFFCLPQEILWLRLWKINRYQNYLSRVVYRGMWKFLREGIWSSTDLPHCVSFKCDSVIHVYSFFSFFSLIGFYKILSIVPWYTIGFCWLKKNMWIYINMINFSFSWMIGWLSPWNALIESVAPRT